MQIRRQKELDAIDKQSNESDRVIFDEQPPIEDLIENHTFKVIKVGSPAYRQLPVVDQARVLLNHHRVAGKQQKGAFYYHNSSQTREMLK